MNCEEMSMFVFVQIINEITSSSYEDELKVNMNCLCVRVPYLRLYFDYGFEMNCMWVKEHGYSERMILVEF